MKAKTLNQRVENLVETEAGKQTGNRVKYINTTNGTQWLENRGWNRELPVGFGMHWMLQNASNYNSSSNITLFIHKTDLKRAVEFIKH